MKTYFAGGETGWVKEVLPKVTRRLLRGGALGVKAPEDPTSPSLTTSSTVAAPPERSRSVSRPLVTLASMGHLLLRLLWLIISRGDREVEGHVFWVDPLFVNSGKPQQRLSRTFLSFKGLFMSIALKQHFQSS